MDVPFRSVGVELKGVRGGVKRQRGRGLKARDVRRDTPGRKVLKDRRSPRERGRMGTSVMTRSHCWDRRDVERTFDGARLERDGEHAQGIRGVVVTRRVRALERGDLGGRRSRPLHVEDVAAG
eukprot:29071-Pelagococcus_subviridis.AAC.1